MLLGVAEECSLLPWLGAAGLHHLHLLSPVPPRILCSSLRHYSELEEALNAARVYLLVSSFSCMHFSRQPHVSGSSALAGGHGMGGQAWHSDAQESPERGNHSHWTALQQPCKGTAKPSCPHGHKVPTCFSGGRCFWFISRRRITDSWGKVSQCPLTCDSAWRKWDVRMLLLWRWSQQQLLASRCLDSLVKLEIISMALTEKGKKKAIASTFTPFYMELSTAQVAPTCWGGTCSFTTLPVPDGAHSFARKYLEPYWILPSSKCHHNLKINNSAILIRKERMVSYGLSLIKYREVSD